MIAGAFARGVAEAFTLLGLPAFFLDREGHVLFATEATRGFADGRVMLRSGHLLAGTAADNRVLARFVERALSDAAGRPEAMLAAAGLSLRALPVPGPDLHADQLLHAIVVLTDVRAPHA